MKLNKKMLFAGMTACIVSFIIVCICHLTEMIGPIQTFSTSRLEILACQDVVGEITNDVVIKQEFVAEESEIDSFAFRVATYSAIKDSNLFVTLYDKTENRVLQKWERNTKGIGDNSFTTFVLDTKLEGIQGHMLELEITSDASGGNAVTLWTNQSNNYQGILQINDIEQSGQIALGSNVLSSSSRINYVYLFVISFIVLLGLYFAVQYNILKKLCNWISRKVQWVSENYKKLLFIGVLESLCFAMVLGIELCLYNFGYTSSSMGYINEYRAAMIFSCFSIIVFFVYFRKSIEKRPENLFLAVSLIIGCLYVYSLPAEVFVSWDEAIHYFRAVSLSRCITGQASSAEAWLFNNNGLRPENFRNIAQLTQQQIMLQEMYNTGITSPIRAEYLKEIWVVCYLPSAVTIALGRFLGLPYTVVFRMGAASNMALYVVLCYFAIKKVKSGKMIISVVSLMTTSMFLAARYSYDTWLTAWYILGTAYFLASMQRNQKVSFHELCIMWGAFFFGSFAKVVYFPIMCCLLFIPMEKFENKEQCVEYRISVITSVFILAAGMVIDVIYLPILFAIMYAVCHMVYRVCCKLSRKQVIIGASTVLLVCGCVGLLVAYKVLPGMLGIGDTRGGAVNAGAQFTNILNHPIEYLKVLENFLSKTYLNYNASDGWTYNFRSLAYLGLSSWKFIPVLLFLYVLVTDKNEYDAFKNVGKIRLGFICIIFVTICMIATVLYISFTPYLSTEIAGCQARYLIPLALPFAAILGSSKVQNHSNRYLYNGVIMISCFSILILNSWEMMGSLYF